MLTKKIKGEDRESRLSPLTVVMLVLLVAYCVMLLGLIFWMTITALKKPIRGTSKTSDTFSKTRRSKKSRAWCRLPK